MRWRRSRSPSLPAKRNGARQAAGKALKTQIKSIVTGKAAAKTPYKSSYLIRRGRPRYSRITPYIGNRGFIAVDICRCRRWGFIDISGKLSAISPP
jgi:hypothetical protein